MISVARVDRVAYSLSFGIINGIKLGIEYVDDVGMEPDDDNQIIDHGIVLDFILFRIGLWYYIDVE